MNLSDLKAIIEVVESVDPCFTISTQYNLSDDLESDIGFIYFANAVQGPLPDHPAIVLRGGMLGIDLSWSKG